MSRIKRYRLLHVLCFCIGISAGLTATLRAAPTITEITAPSSTGTYEKFEITFQVNNIVAGNFFLPYDPAPPDGIDLNYPRHDGITVDGLFLPPGESEWIQQPGFYFEGYDRDGNWMLSNGQNAWKVRFSPHKIGNWQFKLRAWDASGGAESASYSFTVTDTNHRGFVRVSPRDPRYFEFTNGDPFHVIGFNEPHWEPLYTGVQPNDIEARMKKYGDNGINLLRVWISEMYGAGWLAWYTGRGLWQQYIPRSGVTPFSDSHFNPPRQTLTMLVRYPEDWFDACRVNRNEFPVKPYTSYRVRIKYWGANISGPRVAGQPYGFVGKIGGWTNNCYEPDTLTPVTTFGGNTTDWAYVEGTWNSGSNTYMPRFHLAMANVTSGDAYVDSVSMQEVLGNNQYGPNLVNEPSMEYELYVPEFLARQLDLTVEEAEKNDVFLKLVMIDKADKVFLKIQKNGTWGSDDEVNIFGDGRTLNKTRWLLAAYYRYAQARWGYSRSIHSWEFTNEGDVAYENHFITTDEMGKEMKCRVFGENVGYADGDVCTFQHPNHHLITTSFPHSLFPFWLDTAKYPNVDYGDIHAYSSSTGWIQESALNYDAALYHARYSEEIAASLSGYTDKKPVVRGESGIDLNGVQQEPSVIFEDTQGVWLHNFIWATLHPGALGELYWWKEGREYGPGPDGSTQNGLLEICKALRWFTNDIPISNGNYQDAEARSTNANLRLIGQKDLKNGRAHLWIQNRNHTWKNVVDNVTVAPQSGTVTITGFVPNSAYSVEWWNTYTYTAPSTTQSNVTTDGTGTLTLSVINLTTDIAVKIEGSGPQGDTTPPAPPTRLRIVE